MTRIQLAPDGRIEIRRAENGVVVSVWSNLNRACSTFVASTPACVDLLMADVRRAIEPPAAMPAQED